MTILQAISLILLAIAVAIYIFLNYITAKGYETCQRKIRQLAELIDYMAALRFTTNQQEDGQQK